MLIAVVANLVVIDRDNAAVVVNYKINKVKI